ncbi:MAG: AAA family ATPase [Pseudomonadota bacterium]
MTSETHNPPWALKLLWQLGGADGDMLKLCPSHEQTKFAMLGTTTLLLTLGLSYLSALWGAQTILDGVKNPLISEAGGVFVGLLVFMLSATLLASALSITSLVRFNIFVYQKEPSPNNLMSMYRNFALCLLIPALVAAWAAYSIVKLQIFSGEIPEHFSLLSLSSLEKYFLTPFVLSSVVLLIPFIVAAIWQAPVYAAKVIDSKIKRQEKNDKVEDESNNRTSNEPDELSLRIDALGQAHAENSHNLGIAKALTELLIEDGQYSRAIEMFDEMILRDPNDVDLIKGQSELFLKTGDTRRFVSSQNRLDRINSQASFADNLNKTIKLKSVTMRGLDFFGDFSWKFQSHVNILLGRNGYGKSYLLRSLIAMLQNEEDFTQDYFNDAKEKAFIDVGVTLDGEPQSTLRDARAFRQYFGQVPILAIPDMRYINKSQSTVSARSDAVTDLRTQSAWHFLNDRPYEDLIESFLYGLCLDYMQAGEKFQAPLFKLIESSIRKLSDSSFKFDKIVRKDSAHFEIYALTDGNQNTSLRLQKASQGTLSVISMIGLVYRYLQAINNDVPEKSVRQQTGIVIIDEIDAHLHPTWQSKILDLFRESFPNVQFLVTAHSPLVIRGSKEREVSVLKKSKGNFMVDTLPNHFIGATYDRMYGQVFDVEGEDRTFVQLDMAYDEKEKYELELRKLEELSERNEEDELKLKELRDKLYYLREFKVVRDNRESQTKLQEEIHQIELENEQLKGKVLNLETELSRFIDVSTPDEARVDEAVEFFSELIAENAENKSVLEAIANYLAQRGRHWQASTAYEALVSADPENVEYLKVLSNQYQGLEQ